MAPKRHQCQYPLSALDEDMDPAKGDGLDNYFHTGLFLKLKWGQF